MKDSVYESGGKTTVAGEFCDGLVTGLSQRDQQEGEILKAREIRHRLLADPNNPCILLRIWGLGVQIPPGAPLFVPHLARIAHHRS